MKKIYSLAVALIFTTASFAQVSEQGNADLSGTKAFAVKHQSTKTITDTVSWVPNPSKWLPGEFAVGGTVTLYNYTTGGTVYGPNASANDIDISGQCYLNLGAINFGVEGILIGFWRKDENSAGSTMDVQLWTVAANKAWGNQSGGWLQDSNGPNTMVGSTSLPLASADTNWFTLSYAQFSSVLPINGTDFAAIVDFSGIEAAGDSVGVASDQLGEGYRLAVHHVGVNNRWYITNDLFGGALDNNVAMFPVIDETFVGVEDHDFYNEMQLSAYPNPAINETNIAYNLNADMDNVTLIVYDMTGKEVYNKNFGSQVKGSYNVSLDASEFTSGNYFYSLISNGNRLTKRMVFVK